MVISLTRADNIKIKWQQANDAACSVLSSFPFTTTIVPIVDFLIEVLSLISYRLIVVVVLIAVIIIIMVMMITIIIIIIMIIAVIVVSAVVVRIAVLRSTKCV